MRSRLSNLLGIGLLVLWIVGLGSADARPWLTWLDGAGALGAFALGAFIAGYNTRQAKVGSSLSLGLALMALWLIGVLTPGPVWQAWWTFAFACAFILQGIAMASGSAPPRIGTGRPPTQEEIDREKMRRSA